MKKSSLLSQTPAAISTLESDEISLKGITSPSDIKFQVPSMSYTSIFGEPYITIRGVSGFNNAPGVSVSVDGVYQSKSTSSILGEVDLERIEVIRGPQGTLYGRNSNGGVVNFITASPSGNKDGYIKLGYASFAQFMTEFSYNNSLTKRTNFRFSASNTNQGDGYVKCLTLGCEDVNKSDRSSVRLKLSTSFNENLTSDIILAKTNLEGPNNIFQFVTDNRIPFAFLVDTPQIVGVPISLNPNEVYLTPDSESIHGNDSKREYEVAAITINYESRLGLIKSITSYQEYFNEFSMDRDATTVNLYDTFDTSTTETITQEFNWNIDLEGSSWILGAFLMDDDTSRRTLFDLPLPVFGFPVPGKLEWDHQSIDIKSKAFFIDGTFDLDEKTELSLGLRRTKDEFKSIQLNRVFLNLGQFIPVSTTCDRKINQNFQSDTSRLVIKRILNNRFNAYLSYSEGFKAGGIATYECSDPYKPEEVDAFEIGFKGYFNSGKTSLNASLFNYDYTNFQVIQVIGTQTVTKNAGVANVDGLEVEMNHNFSEKLNLELAYSYLDAVYDDFVNLNGLSPQFGFQQLKGNYLNHSPRNSLSIGLNYSKEFTKGKLILQLDSIFRSKTHFTEFNDYAQESYSVFNLNVVWDNASDDLRFKIYAKNLTNEEYLTGFLNSASNGGRFGNYSHPRVFGIEISSKL
ncbi:TonB-dependent receptor plug domain-containing protein [Gammaproteobacteria bacterium]|nr:TonB-dependent receptor plug domain-containing protein [Gammaproteobacteria bacterium]